MTASPSTPLAAIVGNRRALLVSATCLAALASMACTAVADETPPNVKQEGDHLWIDNVPAPDATSGNTYARGMATVLSCLGEDISYDRVMGLTGVAFILQVDTSGPMMDGRLDCAWWPNDAWGFTLGLPVLSQATGWDIRHLQCDMQAFGKEAAAEYRRVLAPAVATSLKAGKPLLAETNHGFVVTGIDNGTPPLLGYGTRGFSTKFEPKIMRLDLSPWGVYPWGIYMIDKKVPAASPRQVDLASLHHIIALFNETAKGPDAPKTLFSGKQAWAAWLGLLKKAMAEGDTSNCKSAWDNNMLIHLRYNRACAVAYLRDMAKRYDGETATHLTVAADLYDQGLADLKAAELPHPGPTKGGLPAYAAMVERVAALEANAIAELQAAADALPKDTDAKETDD